MKVFPVRETEDTYEGVIYKVKTPYVKTGFLVATTDPEQIEKWWAQHPGALVGVWAGGSGICVLDIDVKRGEDGEVLVDGFDSLDKAMDQDWISVPETFSYTTLGGEGQHHIYSLPEAPPGVNGTGNYRGYKGIDRRAGGSYAAWVGPVPDSLDQFAPCPEWLLDAAEVRSLSEFEGTLKDWYDTLEPGKPNVLVRRAILSAQAKFAENGNDYSHSDIVERQHEAIRLGAEGNPGVPELISVLEELVSNREGAHSRPEEQWAHEFAESLASGVRKHGDAILLRKQLPEYDPAMIPSSISDSLISGVPGDNADFSALLRALVFVEDDDLVITSILWNCPKTKDIAHEWGLTFVKKRVADGRVSPPPKTENPTLPDPSDPKKSPTAVQLLTDEQIQIVLDHPTFIDEYLEASEAMKGWCNRDYAIPAAWTLLSMAFGFKGFIPKGRGLPLNLWFLTSGESGTGKAQPLHSKVLTPTGFKTMGEMFVGDEVVTPSGGTAKVSGVYPQGERPVYRVTFGDGRVVEADENHIWSVHRSGAPNATRVYQRTTRELLDDLEVGFAGKSKWFVDAVVPADLGTWDSIIEPYTLGLLLGDAHLGRDNITYTGTDEPLMQAIRGSMPEGMELHSQENTISYRIRFGSTLNQKNPWLDETRRLGLAGMHSRDKFIPESLKNVSVANRLALLQGIMDTDGTPSTTGNSVDYVSASPTLLKDVAWLVRSLGGKATLSEKEVQLKTWDAPRTYYRAYMTLPRGFGFFRLARKQEKINAEGKYDVKSMPIRTIEFKGYEPTQCIMVDHPDHEYVTDGFTRTHNTSEFHLLEKTLDLMLKQPEETYFNLGAGSSPEAMHEALLERDKQPSMVLHDEASDFFENLQRKDWMSGLKDNFSKWYDGYVPPVNKVRLKELKGKSAQSSFNIMMYATPDRLFKQLDSQMFESGFLARFNYVIAVPRDKGDQRRFLVHRTKFDEEGTPPVAYDLISSLLMAIRSHKSAKTALDWTEDAEDILVGAHIKMDQIAQDRDEYEITNPAITRLGDETIWKCAGLLALYRGDRVINEIDAMTAVYYAQKWFDTLFDVVEAIGEGEFARKMDDIETWIRRYPKGVTEASLYNKFRGAVKFSGKDVDALVDYLLKSGRIITDRESSKGVTKYLVNGG